MCRLTAIFSPTNPVLLADVVTRPRLSIIYQSFNCRERLHRDSPRWAYEKSSLNADGFGVGWYMPRAYRNLSSIPEAPCVFTSLKPAWSDRNLKRLAEKVISPLIFAHVRAAGPGTGESTELNCHPYTYGRFMFMHNGLIGEWTRVRRRFLTMLPPEIFEFCLVNGTTDTIALFGLFLSLLDHEEMYEYPALYLRAKLEQTIGIVCRILDEENVIQETLLNIVLTDGNHIVATRHAKCGLDSKGTSNSPCASSRVVIDSESLGDESQSDEEEDPEVSSVLEGASLYFATGSKWERQGQDSDDFHMVHYDKRSNVAIVTSEPLTDCVEEWVPIPTNYVLVVTGALEVLLDKIRLSPLNLTEMPSASQFMRGHSAFGRALSFLAEQPILLEGLEDFGGCRSRRTSNLEQSENLSDGRMAEIHDESRSATVQISETMDTHHSLHGESDDPILCIASITITIPAGTLNHSREAHLIAAGTRRGLIRIWHLESQACCSVVRGHAGSVLCLVPFVDTKSWTPCACSRDKLKFPRVLLMSGGSDTSVVVWDLMSTLCAVFQKSGVPNAVCRSILRIKFRPIQGDVLCLSVHQYGSSQEISPGDVRAFGQFKGVSKMVLRQKSRRRVSVPESPQHGPWLYIGFQNTTTGYVNMAPLLKVASFAQLEVNNSSGAQVASSDTGGCEQYPLVRPPVITLTRNTKNFAGVLKTKAGDDIKLSCGILPYGPSHRHVGFVEALVPCGPLLLSGGGDGLILLWNEQRHVTSLTGHRGGVLCLAADPQQMVVYSGSKDCTIREWDLQLQSCIATLKAHTGAVMAIELTDRFLISSSDTGEVLLWSRPDRMVLMMLTDNGRPQPCAATALGLYPLSRQRGCRIMVVAAGGDGTLRLWIVQRGSSHTVVSTDSATSMFSDVSCRSSSSSEITDLFGQNAHEPRLLGLDDLESLLRKLVSMKSVSGDSRCIDMCLESARCVAMALEDIGAAVRVCGTEVGRSPVVIGRLGNDANKPTVVLYSHYDVVPALKGHAAPDTQEFGQQDWSPWNSNPWELTCIDGYYYGRGVSDNKGPLVAQIFSACLPGSENGLPVNIVWICEGEEESGSLGFKKIIRNNKEIIPDASCIICTNSYWLDDTYPCIVYGMRGVLDIRLSVTGGRDSTGHHSGVHGGAIAEPMADLVRLLASCTSVSGDICVQGIDTHSAPIVGAGGTSSHDEVERLRICSNVMSVQDYEKSLKNAALRADSTMGLLHKRWLEPSLSITEIWATTQQTSNDVGDASWVTGGMQGEAYKTGGTFRLIPSRAFANISVRLVPNQPAREAFELIKSHLVEKFDEFNRGNSLVVKLVNAHDWWLGDVESQIFTAAKEAVSKAWGVEPLLIREGGTMPVISFLQEFLGVAAVQIPMGQSSDSAHLPNERIRVRNLHKGVETLQNIFHVLGRIRRCQATV